MKIYKVSDGIWATREETQRGVNVDTNEDASDDEEAKEAEIRDMEEGDEPMPKGVDEFTTLHNAIDERQATDHTYAQSAGQPRHDQAPGVVIED